MEEFIEQGFEVVTDENGMQLVKIDIMTDNNETTTALVTKEVARQILSGQSIQLQNEIVEDDEKSGIDLGVATGDMAGTSAISSSFDTISKVISNTESLHLATEHQQQQEAEEEADVDGVQFTLTEQPTVVNGQTIYVVSLTDAQGNILDQKQSAVVGEKVTLQMGEQAIECHISGHAEPTSSSFVLREGVEEEEETGEAPPMEDSSDWCPSTLDPSEYSTIRYQVAEFAKQVKPAGGEPEPYNKQLGPLLAYQEMMTLRHYDPQQETKEMFELMRKHAMLFRPSGPNSRQLNQYEHAVNEAAAQLCRFHPLLLFHRRELSVYAKQVIRATQIDFPGSNVTGSSLVQTVNQQSTAGMSLVQTSVQPANQQSQVVTNGKMAQRQRAPLGDNSVHYVSNLPMMRREVASFKLSAVEEIAIRTAVNQILSDLPNYPLKSRADCTNIERYSYEDSLKIMKLPVQRLDDCIEFIREASAIFGRYPGGPRNPNIVLTPFEVACNEAAAYLVRNNAGLLTHRRELTELAKKAVRSCGFFFKHTPMADAKITPGRDSMGYRTFMGGDMMTELDLSAAEQILTDTLEFGESGESQDSDSTDMEGVDVDDEMALFCEESGNVLNETTVLCVTGTDDIKKVRILHLEGCSITSILPLHINRCVNLVELHLKDNALRALPRCLHLSHLKTLDLRGNRLSSVPLVEQFTKLKSLSLDQKIANGLCKQALAYFCPYLEEINGEAFSETVSEASEKSVQNVKTELEAIVHTKWEEDFMGFYKKGIPRSDFIKVVESLVLHVVERNVEVAEPFNNYRDLIARKVAEEFLNPKVMEEEDDEDEEGVGLDRRGSGESDEDQDEELDEDEEARAVERRRRANKAAARRAAREETSGHPLNVEEGQVLLPDEPLDRVSNVIGQAMMQGKCVIYSVVRTAARQPGGDIIQVGGASSPTETAPVTTSTASRPKATVTTSTKKSKEFKANIYDMDTIDTENADPLTSLEEARAKAGLTPRKTTAGPKSSKAKAVASAVSGTRKLKTPTGQARAAAAQSKAKTPARPAAKTQARPVVKTPAKPPAKTPAKSTPAPKPKVVASAAPAIKVSPKETPEREVTSLAAIPPPHSPPPASLTMSTRDSNRMKRFNVYGVIDTAAAQAEAETSAKERAAGFPSATPKARKRVPVSGSAGAADTADEEYPEETSPRRAAMKRKAPTGPSNSLTDLGPVTDYDPLHFIRCHAKDNDPMDCETKVWRCAFEPKATNPTETTNVVGTCGGECVCLIDCRTGKVMKRFKHQGEEFYSLAWTTVEMAAGHHTNLLAAAGKLREIRLLHPEQLVCYAELKGHKDDIACMAFHQAQPTILFSGDAKAQILVWDIGVPSAPEYRTRHQLLLRLICPRANLNPVVNLIFMSDYDSLVAGCEDGVFVWTFSDFKPDKRVEREPDLELKIPTRQEPCFDGLARLSDSQFVVKCVEEGELFVIDFTSIMKKRRASQKSMTVDVRGQLRWQTTDEIYINVTTQPNVGVVVCGDNEGAIWLYDLHTHLGTEDRKKFKAKPIKILEWPECSVGGNKDEDKQLNESISAGFKNPVVNASDLSSDGRYLVAVTDNNLVCIWKFSS